MGTREIRACYDRDSITVYQAYAPEIGLLAAEQGAFVPPFSRRRMTWIKPSFLWLMARSDWARKLGQQTILAVRISRSGWEEALGHAVPTDPDRRVFRSSDEWRRHFAKAVVHVQWDPERSIRGAKLETRSVQIGLSRHIIDRYVDDWILGIEDRTLLARRIRDLLLSGRPAQAKALLPEERPYPLPPALTARLGMS
ncbi:DUF4291 domain-containing protein [Actinomadura bangladeshensis]|uniref:DUF4291 domain-containing protein n=1 Tax=Actinomadura bangladeshensis TaxID=453573 RepID=A0A4R4NJ32_9ACTN|nr:DUF4291 domain-containing protein [Actinomadura bangladeshensis]TDC07713.1 DUF4291 domain-containing protein [Actinomadura bangladeshensis]